MTPESNDRMDGEGQELLQDFRSLSRELLRGVNRARPRARFLAEASEMLLDFFGCDEVELRVREARRNCTRSRATRRPERDFSYAVIHCAADETADVLCGLEGDSALETIFRTVLAGAAQESTDGFTENGSFFTGAVNTLEGIRRERESGGRTGALGPTGGYRSLAAVPVTIEDEKAGLLLLKSLEPDFFDLSAIGLAEGTAEILGMSLAHGKAQAALGERVKELTCLYGIARIVEEPGIGFDDMFDRIVHLLPPGWQYPEVTEARLILDEREHATSEFKDSWQVQSADIVVKGQRRGVVQVAYSEMKQLLDEGPFLTEERNLIGAISAQLAHIVERKEAEQETERLQVQLRHADRLATIGQLAAGVAHELNEPLGAILGFAQLAMKCPGLPQQGSEDIDRIIAASLHARQIITKLLLFARQTPSKKIDVDLDEVVEESLFFFDARCAKEGIRMVRSLAGGLPMIVADAAQLRQVTTNLVVNAIQAMPETGTLTVATLAGDKSVELVVEDTGTGMSEEVQEKLFLPFFTTKDVNQGTGLGMAVVHGIVTAHGGSIEVETEEGKGSRFRVRFPVAGTGRGEQEKEG